jgi:hypothetical protein
MRTGQEAYQPIGQILYPTGSENGIWTEPVVNPVIEDLVQFRHDLIVPFPLDRGRGWRFLGHAASLTLHEH